MSRAGTTSPWWSYQLNRKRIGSIIRHELRVLRHDPVPAVPLLAMPLLLMAFLKPGLREALVVVEGYRTANGAEQVVPGMAVMFSFVIVPNVGMIFFREHGWNTWDRLRGSHARDAEIMIAKVVVPLGMVAVQLTILFVVGWLLLDLHIRGSLWGVVLTSAALGLCVVSLGLLLTATCRTVMQLGALANVGALVMAGLGGALLPVSMTPGWARALAPATPSYWAMRSYRQLILEGDGLGAVLLPIAVLLGFAALFAFVASRRFRFGDRKVSWA